MKKILTGIMVLCLMVIFGVSQALAADSGSIAVTVTITSAIDITVGPGTWAIESLTENGTADTLTIGPNYFTVTNNSNVTTDLTTTVGNSTDWNFANDPGTELFAMDQTITGDATWTQIDTGGTVLASGLAAHTDQTFDLQFHAPSQTDHGGTAQSFSVTITATP